MSDTVLAQLAALKTAPIGALKQKWRDLFESEPPPYNRRFLEHRLAYRIQELVYGGLKPETLRRLRQLAEELDGGDLNRRRQPAKDRPIAGTQLIREYQGECPTIREIAIGEKINESYVGRVLRLTLLAPEIVETILGGRQPAGLQLDSLMKRFPVDWRAQRDGFFKSCPTTNPS